MESTPRFLSLLLVAVFCFQVCYTVKIKPTYSWSPFIFQNLPHKGDSIVEGHHYQYYNSCSILPYSISYQLVSKCFFLAIPRVNHGNPCTVAFFNVQENLKNKAPALCGFPTAVHNYVPGWFNVDTLPADDYKYNIYQGYTKTTPYFKSHHLISVKYLVGNHPCSRLYFVDTGTLEYPEGNICVRPPSIWGFAIDGCSEHEFDKPPALKVTIPAHLVKDPTGFGAFDIDNYGNCEEFALYIPNYKDNRIVVYDNVKRSLWFFEHKTFRPLAERPYITDYNAPEDPYKLGVLSVIVAAEEIESGSTWLSRCQTIVSENS